MQKLPLHKPRQSSYSNNNNNNNNEITESFPLIVLPPIIILQNV